MIVVEDYLTLSYNIATAVTAGVYAFMFHNLLTMVYLMRDLYLLAIGGAVEQPPNASTGQEEDDETEPQETTI